MSSSPARSIDEFRIATASFAAGAASAGGLPPPALPEVAFAGRSNVGKSSLLNTLVQRKSLVRTSRTPGCTRHVNLFEVDVVAHAARPAMHLFLADLPGYGYARRSREERLAWEGLLESYLRRRGSLRAVVLLVDVRRGLEEEERELLEFLAAPRPAGPIDRILVATKLDKIPRSQRVPALTKIRQAAGRDLPAPIGFSSVDGEGREVLWRALARAVAASGPAVAVATQ